MKTSVIITARMSSKRLPGKVLKQNNICTMIEYLIERVKKSKLIDDIIVATTDKSEDNILVKTVKKTKVKVFRGSENNVTGRVFEAAKKFKIQNIVLITGDCPLIDYEIMDQCIRTFQLNSCDFLSNANIRSYPDGMDIQIFTYKTLKKSIKEIKLNIEKEHVTLNLRRNINKYKAINLLAPSDHFYPNLGLTLDEKLDYDLINNVIKHLHIRKKYFNCLDIIRFLNSHPKYLVNKKIKRKGDS